MVATEAIATQLLNGIVYGSILSMIAMGLSIIFGLLGIINFAHGAFYALGIYVGLTMINAIASPFAFFLALLVVPVVIGIAGVGVERTIIQPLYDRDGLLAPLLLTFGLMLVIHAVIIFIWGETGRSMAAPEMLAITLDLGITNFPAYRLFVAIFMLLVGGLVWVFLNKTELGMIVRAATENRTIVKVLGININRIYTIVFVIGTAIAGLAGLLHAPMINIYPEMGTEILIISFVVVVIGGLNSFKGSIVAGILVGVVSSLSFLVWPALTNIIIFVFMAVFLLLRPQGLFGQEVGGIGH